MKKALSIFTAVCCAGILLSGCSSKDKDTYIDIDSNFQIQDSELAEKLEQESTPLNTVVSDYKQYSNRKSLLAPIVMCCTIDNRYLYSFWQLGFTPTGSYSSQKTQCYRIDLQSGELLPMCDTPGCTHDVNLYPDCINNKYGFISPTSVGDTIWYSKENKLIELKDGKETVLYENDYCTEFEEQFSQENPLQKYGFSVLLDDSDYIYAFGSSYTFRINRKTMKPEQYINVTDDAMTSRFVYENKAYVTDLLQELFVIDYETGEVTKLGDMINNAAVYDDVLYYTKYNGGRPILYTAELDGSGKKKLLEDCYMDFIVKDGKVFYHNNTGSNALHSYDLKTGEDSVIYDDWARCNGIVTADHIDRIFAISDVYRGSSETSSDEEAGTYSVIVSIRTDGSDLWVKEITGRE